jgi:hypothetical protein
MAMISTNLCRTRGEWELHASRERARLRRRLSAHDLDAHLFGDIMHLCFGGIAMSLRNVALNVFAKTVVAALVEIASNPVAARVDTNLHPDELYSGAIPYIRGLWYCMAMHNTPVIGCRRRV